MKVVPPMPHNLLNTTFCNEPDNSLSAPQFSFYFMFHCVHNAGNETRPKSTWRQQSKRRRRRWWYHVRNCKAFQTYWPEEKKDNRRQNQYCQSYCGWHSSWSHLPFRSRYSIACLVFRSLNQVIISQIYREGGRWGGEDLGLNLSRRSFLLGEQVDSDLLYEQSLWIIMQWKRTRCTLCLCDANADGVAALIERE